MSATTAASRRFYHPLQKDYATFLETSEESGGARTLIQIELAPRGGNARHRHLTYAEHFQVLEGRLVVHLEGIDHELGPGDTAVAPAGSIHCFRNPTDETVVFRVELRPGHRGFERALQVGYALAAEGRCRRDGTPRNVFELAVLASWSDVRVAGVVGVLNPVLGLLAGVARRRGVDRELASRYVTF
jgi:quercetin dioxygenase-like cupin family protein